MEKIQKVQIVVGKGREKVTNFFAWFRQASLKKKIAVILVALIVLYIVTIPLRRKQIQYQTAAVTRGTIQETISESGNVAANGQTAVTSSANGVIQELDVKNGETVTAGQQLFKVKATASPQEQASAFATYENALSTLQTAQNNTQSLDAVMWTKQQAYLAAQNTKNFQINNQTNPATKSNYTALEIDQINSAVVQTQKDFDAAQQTYKTSNVAVSAAQAAVNSTKLGYQATEDVTVVSPLDGKIENLGYTVGDKVNAGTSSLTSSTTTVNASPVLYIVTDGMSKNALAVVQINEVDFPKIKPGQQADITLPAFPNKKFTGHVTNIDALGTNTSSVISFNVYVSIDNPNVPVAPNMTVDVDINTARHEDVLTVPNAAIKPYQGGKAVQVYDKTKSGTKRVHYVPVTVGLRGIDKTEILSGVGAGTVVVTGGGSTTTITPGS